MLTDQEIDNLCSEWLYVAPGRTYEEHRPFARAIESATTAPLLARIEEQDALIATLRLEAQIHAQEARTANATIAEIYQSVTGGTGEPGNWHGAAPVKARIAELEQLRSEDHAHAIDLASEIERLTRELEEARKDAEAGWNARAKQLLSVPMPEDAPTTSGGFRAAIKEQT